MKCTKINGPGKIIDSDQNNLLAIERSAFAKCLNLANTCAIKCSDNPSTKFLNSTLTRIVMGRYDPLATISAMLRVTDSDRLQRDGFACFQFIVRFVNPHNESELVTRVYNHKLTMKKQVKSWKES